MRTRMLVATACILAATGSAHAQRSISLTVAGGVSLPVGSFAAGAGTGWHAGAGLLVSSLWQPIGLRIDATHHRFAFENEVPGHQAITSGTLSLLYRLPSAGWPVAPYVAAGAGAYHATCGGDIDCDSATNFGWSAGVGMRTVVFGLHTFLE